jgi:hypothetical protein
MSKKDIHGVPRDGAWAVRREARSAIPRTTTEIRPDGPRATRRGASASRAVEHGRDGRIQDSDSMATTPSPRDASTDCHEPALDGRATSDLTGQSLGRRAVQAAVRYVVTVTQRGLMKSARGASR